MTIQFDTLTFAKRLTEAGERREIAEAHAFTLKELVMDNLATKADVTGLRSELKADVTSLRSELKAEAASLRSEIKELATALRAEMKETETSLRSDIRALDGKLGTEIALVRRDMDAQTLKLTVRLGGMLAVMTGVIATLIKLL